MPRDRDLSFAATPNVVPPAAPDKGPAESPQPTLEVTPFHDPNIHIYV